MTFQLSYRTFNKAGLYKKNGPSKTLGQQNNYMYDNKFLGQLFLKILHFFISTNIQKKRKM